MQAIAELVPKADENTTQKLATTSTGSTKKQLPKHWQTALFDRFKSIYGNKFTDQFKTTKESDEHMREWAESLVDLEVYEMKRGIEACRDKKSWPPSIAEFRELAKGASPKDWEHKGQAYKLHKKALPAPKASVEVKNAAIKELRGLLGRKRANQQPVKRVFNIPTPEECEIQPEKEVLA